MRRLFCIILIMGSIVSVSAQNRQLEDFMESLSERGARVSVSRVNDKYHLSRRYNVTFDHDSLLADSICIFLDRLARKAVESYRYESHRNGNDTITYSIGMRGYGNNEDYLIDLARVEPAFSSWFNDYSDFHNNHSWLYPNPYQQQEKRFMELLGSSNRKMYFGARESVLFDYVGGRGNIICASSKENDAMGTYYHFDISPLDSLLTVLLPSGTRQKRVHYQHVVGEPVDKSTTYYSTDYLLPKRKGNSESTGMLYVVGKKQGAERIYRQLLQAAQHHLDNNPTQCCVLEYTKSHFKLSGIKNTTKLLINQIAMSSFLMADLDKSGTLYILRLDVDGEYWIPRDWKQIQ